MGDPMVIIPNAIRKTRLGKYYIFFLSKTFKIVKFIGPKNIIAVSRN